MNSIIRGLQVCALVLLTVGAPMCAAAKTVGLTRPGDESPLPAVPDLWGGPDVFSLMRPDRDGPKYIIWCPGVMASPDQVLVSAACVPGTESAGDVGVRTDDGVVLVTAWSKEDWPGCDVVRLTLASPLAERIPEFPEHSLVCIRNLTTVGAA